MADLRRAAAQVEGVQLYMQPVQDISVEDIVSRTDTSTACKIQRHELSNYAAAFVARLNKYPNSRTWQRFAE